MSEIKIERLDESLVTEKELTEKIQFLVDTANVTGLVVTVFNDNIVAYSKAFGWANSDTKDSLRLDQGFYGASLSKAVFGYLVAQIVDEGVLDLDKPLQAYLDLPISDLPFEKEWRNYSTLKGDKRLEKITARMCLSHQTGFPNWRFLTKDGDFDREGQIRFEIDPGMRYSYSGEGIYLLQIVLEKITGQDLESMARQRIFDPLGMEMTSYVWQDRFENEYCNGHTNSGVVIKKDKEDDANAAGSMETTMQDYNKFLLKILSLEDQKSSWIKTLFHKNVRILSQVQFGSEAWQDTDANDNIELGYGLGWGLLQTPHGYGAFKEGHSEGFQHYSILFPEKNMGIAIMSNSDNGESIFKEVLEVSIGDIYTPWKWERYIPWDR